VKFTVPGVPVSWMVQQKKLGAFVSPVTHDKTIAWQARVAEAARAAGLRVVDGPVRLRCLFAFEWPPSKWRKRAPRELVLHDGKPDLTNLEKAAEDALTGIAYRDDKQVARKDTVAVRLPQGMAAFALIEVMPWRVVPAWAAAALHECAVGQKSA